MILPDFRLQDEISRIRSLASSVLDVLNEVINPIYFARKPLNIPYQDFVSDLTERYPALVLSNAVIVSRFGQYSLGRNLTGSIQMMPLKAHYEPNRTREDTLGRVVGEALLETNFVILDDSPETIPVIEAWKKQGYFRELG